jgi:hypothetical protein
MSTAFYPLGMSTYNNRLPQGGYKTWKGTGISSNPVGITSGHIRPLTNNDPGNVFPTKFGLPRPLKQYRKGTVITNQQITPVNSQDTLNVIETNLINYNLNRAVKSSNGASLGGGSGGLGLLNQMLDTPGQFIVKQNSLTEKNNVNELNKDCNICQGVGIVASYYPNIPYLTENPESNTTNYPLCCNQEKKALRRVIPASTKLKKNYYTTLQQYRQNRCKTYDQKVFNFKTNLYNIAQEKVIQEYTNNPFITEYAIKNSKPGDPLSLLNMYIANCQPNAELEETTEINIINKLINIMLERGILTAAEVLQIESLNISYIKDFVNYIASLPDTQQRELAIQLYNEFITNPYIGMPITGPTNPIGCKLVVYKPNNPQFAKQGAVSSSTRMLKLNVTTIEKNIAGYNKDQKIGAYNEFETGVPVALNPYGQPAIPFLYKNKAQGCNAQIQIHQQNHKSCSKGAADPYQPARPSNHFQQSPRNPLM